jgi:CHAD domain-containing protein
VRELETKYRASRDLVFPALDGRLGRDLVVDEPSVTRLTATYYDTPDLRLAREGITLRRRTGGSDDGWHLKLPVATESAVTDGAVRDEIQLPDSGEAVPDRLAAIVTGYLRFGRLGPAATLVTERTTRRVRDREGTVLAEIVDDRVTVEGTGHVSAGFREIEVEDFGGGASVLDAVGGVLRESGAVGGTFMPKLVRALGARASAPPDPPLPEELTSGSSAAALLTAYLRTQVRKLVSEDVRFRLGGEDAVHQLRVSCRRMRSVLRTFRPLLDVEWSEELRVELKWVANELGIARDSEVLLARLERMLAELPPEQVLGPVAARLEQVVGGRLAAGVATTTAVLDGDRYRALLERLVDAAWTPRTNPEADRKARDVVPGLIRNDWRRLARGVARVRETHAAEDYHQVRIAAKRLRYASEAAVPIFGAPAKRLATQAERVQEVLGEHQDAQVSEETLRVLAQSSTGRQVGFTLGLLHSREQTRARAARKLFEEIWPEVSRRRYRDWLRT